MEGSEAFKPSSISRRIASDRDGILPSMVRRKSSILFTRSSSIATGIIGFCVGIEGFISSLKKIINVLYFLIDLYMIIFYMVINLSRNIGQ
jgi:hypothetical protein